MNRVATFVKQHTWCWLLILNIVFAWFGTCVLPCAYESNDDELMALIASGQLLGHADNHLVFINHLYGSVESQLYVWIPSVEWHTMLLLLWQVVSLTIVGVMVVRSRQSSLVRMSAILMIYLLALHTLQNLQFTTTAGWLASAGLMLILSRKRGALWVGMGLFWIASLLRFPSAMFAGVAVAVFYPYMLSRRGFHWGELVSLSLAALFSVGTYWVDCQYYQQDKEWAEYYQYNKLRGRVNDNPNSWRAVDNPPEGMCREDVMLTMWYFFPEAARVGTPELQHILRAMDESAAWHGIPQIKRVKVLFAGGAIKGFAPYLTVLFLMVLLVGLNSERKQRRWLWMAAGFIFLLCCIVSCIIWLKPRALFCLLLPSLLILWIHSDIRRWQWSSILISLLTLWPFPPKFHHEKWPDISPYIEGRPVVRHWWPTNRPFNLGRWVENNLHYGWTYKIPSTNQYQHYWEYVGKENCLFVTENIYYDMFVDLFSNSVRWHYGLEVYPHIHYSGDFVRIFSMEVEADGEE